VLKSFCIKTNNSKVLAYLLKEVDSLAMKDLFFSENHFKNYKNIIVHYTGDYTPLFLNLLSEIITDTIVNFYEKKLLARILNTHYFYFSDYEKNEIVDLCLECFHPNNEDDVLASEDRKGSLYNSVHQYIQDHKSFVLEGFINFRLKEYTEHLESVVDLCVNKFLIEREYIEFIKLLRLYVESTEPNVGSVHLIYVNENSIILDEDKNIISLDDNIFRARYLSDITFSSNDFALNTLLTLLPENIYLHLVDPEDEFITTLSLIFDDKIKICTNCELCNLYHIGKYANHNITKI